MGEKLIKAGHMYADDTPVDLMRDVSLCFFNHVKHIYHYQSAHMSQTIVQAMHFSFVSGISYAVWTRITLDASQIACSLISNSITSVEARH